MNVLKSNLSELQIDVDNWEALSENRGSWRKPIGERCSNFHRKPVEHVALKSALRMQDDTGVPTDVLQELKCSVYGRFLLTWTCQRQVWKTISNRMGRGATKQFMRRLCLHVLQNPPILHVA